MDLLKITTQWSVNIKGTLQRRQVDGPYERYHQNGQLQAKVTYKDGVKDGPYEDYHTMAVMI